MLVQLKEGWKYVSGFAPIRTILLLFAIVSLMGWPFTVLMPIFAAKVLKGGPHTLGFLMAAMGVGALVSAVSLAVRRTVLGLGRMIPLSAGTFGVGLIFFGLSRNLWISLVLMLVCGFGLMQQMAASNTIIQTIVEESKRGRVMSFYTMAFVGMAPFGSLLAGGLANLIGAPRTVMLTGACCVLGAIWFASHLRMIRRLIRPIYADLGYCRRPMQLSRTAWHGETACYPVEEPRFDLSPGDTFNPREVLRLRCAPAESAGKAKTRNSAQDDDARWWTE